MLDVQNLVKEAADVESETVFFLLAGIMCLSTFSPPEYVEPQVKNLDTGVYFLPDYGNTLISSHRSGKGAAPIPERVDGEVLNGSSQAEREYKVYDIYEGTPSDNDDN